jgi:hypothetical protein
MLDERNGLFAAFKEMEAPVNSATTELFNADSSAVMCVHLVPAPLFATGRNLVECPTFSIL